MQGSSVIIFTSKILKGCRICNFK